MGLMGATPHLMGPMPDGIDDQNWLDHMPRDRIGHRTHGLTRPAGVLARHRRTLWVLCSPPFSIELLRALLGAGVPWGIGVMGSIFFPNGHGCRLAARVEASRRDEPGDAGFPRASSPNALSAADNVL
jgi:hypothetical protein